MNPVIKNPNLQYFLSKNPLDPDNTYDHEAYPENAIFLCFFGILLKCFFFFGEIDCSGRIKFKNILFFQKNNGIFLGLFFSWKVGLFLANFSPLFHLFPFFPI